MSKPYLADLYGGQSGARCIVVEPRHVQSSVASANAAIQDAIDELEGSLLADDAGGTVLLPACRFTTSVPILQPRTTINGYSAVSIIGQGYATQWFGDNALFPPGRALLERKPIAGATPSTGRWRSLNQRVGNMLMRQADQLGCKAIWFEYSGANPDTTTERWSGQIFNMWFQPQNNLHSQVLRIDGNVHQFLFRDLAFDPSIIAGTFNTVAITLEDGVDDAIDSGGGYAGAIERITCSPTAGGSCALFRGRLVGSAIRNSIVGIGTFHGATPEPQIHLINGADATIEGFQSEGNISEPAIVLMENCRGSSIKRSNIGYNVLSTGNSIALVNCVSCQVEDIPYWPNKPAFSPNGVYRVSIDADCVDCSIDGVQLNGVDTLANAIQNLGQNSRLRTVNVTFDRVEVFPIAGVYPPEQWFQDNVAALQVNVALGVRVSQTFTTWQATRPGSIVAIATRFNSPITAGQAHVRASINGTPTTLGIFCNAGSNPSGGRVTQQADIDSYAAGDLITVVISTDVGFLPTTTDLEAYLEIVEE